MTFLRLVYLANVVVAGTVGALSLLAPARAAATVWQGTTPADAAALRVVGAFWVAIAACSALGLAWPRAFAAVLVVQLLYKAGWLLVVALPAIAAGRGTALPAGIAAFFAVWVLVLPFVIPYRLLTAR